MKTEGKKFDTGKARWDLLPYAQLEKGVEVLTFGSIKYGDNNWKGVETHRYKSALMRHLVAYFKGETFDEESKKEHLAHALCNILFLMYKDEEERNNGKDTGGHK